MPPNTHTDDSNSWTNYQKMVLSELERHEEKQDNLQNGLTDLRLIVAKLAAELTHNTIVIQTLAAQMKMSENKASEQQTDISLLKYKIGFVASAISTGLTLFVQIGIKYLEHAK